MGRIRVLALLSLTLAIIGFFYGYDELLRTDAWNLDKQSFRFAAWIFAYLALATVSGLSVISSMMIFLLSFFALVPEADGSFVIDRKSLYGRFFLLVAGLKNEENVSYCLIFWQTNMMLFFGSFIAAFISSIGLVIWKLAEWDEIASGSLTVLWWTGVIVSAVIVIIALGFAVWALWRRVSQNTQFSLIYNKYLCPRIKVR